REGRARPGRPMQRWWVEAVGGRALETLPARFKRKLDNIAVIVEDWPDAATLREMGVEPPDTLYGLYRGVDLTHRDTAYGGVLPDTITIYQGPIEEDCADEREMTDEVRATVIHELGHYFGLTDEEMEQLEQ